MLRVKDNRTKDRITKIKRKVGIHISATVIKNYLTQEVTDK